MEMKIKMKFQKSVSVIKEEEEEVSSSSDNEEEEGKALTNVNEKTVEEE